MGLAAQLECALTEDMGFDASVTEPTPETEAELRRALRAYVLDNDKSEIVRRIDGIRRLLEKGKFQRLLAINDHGLAWRFIDATSPSQLEDILGVSLGNSTAGKLTSGVLKPDHRGLSSWTVNPRSLVYSGYFSVIPPDSSLALVQAKTRGPNVFFGNPDEMVSALDIEGGNGYALEREVLAVGPVTYDVGVWTIRDSSRSLEGQAMDLINDLVPVSSLKGKWSDRYYFPVLDL